jgi:hypothetical protein
VRRRREHRVWDAAPLEVAPVCLPRASCQLADPRAQRLVAHDDELPGLAVLGARCVRRRLEHPLDDRVVDGLVRERAMRAQRAHDVEEARLGHGVALAISANVFT